MAGWVSPDPEKGCQSLQQSEAHTVGEGLLQGLVIEGEFV